MKAEMRRYILDQLRIGTSVSAILDMLTELESELKDARVYMLAIEEAKFRP
jgi:hypothetical protein